MENKTHYKNEQHANRRIQLVKEFGGKCRFCDAREGSINPETGKERHLEFAHKVNWRISGMNRGRNQRILEIQRHKDRFLLLCTSCHRRYDYDHPLTDEELKSMEEEVPF